MRPRLRRFLSIGPHAQSCFFVDLCPDNGL
jgi:hypothetical protein